MSVIRVGLLACSSDDASLVMRTVVGSVPCSFRSVGVGYASLVPKAPSLCGPIKTINEQYMLLL